LLQRGFQSAIKSFIDFDLVTAKVEAISGATSTELLQLENQAKQLGASTAFSASQVAQLQLELSKLGLTAPQILDASEAILDFAVATDSELARAGTVIASTGNIFKVTAGEIADIAAQAFSSSALDIGKFETAISLVGATAKSSKLSLEETTAVLGVLADAGIDASTAATGFRKVLAIAAKQGKDYREVLKEVTDSTNGLKTASELFGLTAQSQAVVLSKSINKIDELTLALENSEGAAARAAAIIGDTLSGDLKRLDSAFEAFTLSIFEGDGALGSFARGLTQLATGFLEVITPQDRLSDGLIRQKNELNLLVGAINETTKGDQSRLDLINELNDKYPTFLGNLNKETVTNEQLLQRLKEVNEEYTKKIRLQVRQEEIVRIEQEIAKSLERERNNLQEIARLRGEFGVLVQDQIKFIEHLEKQLESADDTQKKFIEDEIASQKLVLQVLKDSDETREDLSASEINRNKKLVQQRQTSLREERKNRDILIAQLRALENGLKDVDKAADGLDIPGGDGGGGSGGGDDDLTGVIEKQRKLVADIRKEREKANEDEIAEINERLKLAQDELDRLLKLGEKEKELTEFRKRNIKEQADFTKDEIELVKFKNEIIADIINDEIATEEEKAEAIRQIEEATNEDILRRRLERSEKELDILNKFGSQEIENEKELNQKILDKTKEIEDLKTQVLKEGVEERGKITKDGLEDQVDELKELARNPVIEGAIQGLRERERLRVQEERANAQQIEDEEERQKALDKIARKQARRELALASVTAFQQELSRSGDIQDALKAATDTLVAGTVAPLIFLFLLSLVLHLQ